MTWHKVDKYVPMELPVTTYKRGERKRPRVFKMDELDGFYVDKDLNRTLHITFEKEDIIVIDVYDTVQAAYKPVGETLGIMELNLSTGKVKCYREGR
ncbi:MAG: hypothetical protein Q8O10_08165 [candidate division Zixibacteria bacterium]|nr:hypothetical protein [candidate division Zixibacteria bacterium]